MPHRVGLGEDTHRLAEGGPLIVGGLKLPHDKHAVGHSDADALLHAVTDALLGAAGLADIGELFPNTDPTNAGRNSAEFLRLAYQKVEQAGFELMNLDCVVSLQQPKLSPYKAKIRHKIAAILGVGVDRIGLKAKTGEGVGPVGREEAIMARCVALLNRTR